MKLHISGITATPTIGVVLIFGVPDTTRPALLYRELLLRKNRTGQNRGAANETHLRSTAAVTGYHIEAVDGDIGHVHGFVLDEEAWAIRYIVISTTNWWPGKKVLVSPAWIKKVSWGESKLYAGLTPKRSRALLSTSSQGRFLESSKMIYTCTTASRLIGCTKPSIALHFPRAAFKFGHGHPRLRRMPTFSPTLKFNG
jgi:hypothetical protein